MTQVDQLTNLGYELTADGKIVHCQWQGNGSPPECVRDLLSELKAQKGAVLEYLLKIPNCEISPLDFIVWVEADVHRISNIKDGDKREIALLAFESRCAQFDTLPDSTKQQALWMSMPKESVVASPFDDGCTGADWPVVIADLDNNFL